MVTSFEKKVNAKARHLVTHKKLRPIITKCSNITNKNVLEECTMDQFILVKHITPKLLSNILNDLELTLIDHMKGILDKKTYNKESKRIFKELEEIAITDVVLNSNITTYQKKGEFIE